MVHAEPAADALSFFAKDRASRIATYDEGWSGFIDVIAAHVARGASLAELVSRYDAAIGEYSGFIAERIRRQIPRIALGPFASVPAPRRLAVVNGRYVVLPEAPRMDALFDTIARAIDPAVDCIVEFGCGLGFNLARLRLRLPHMPITYIACEPSEHGRRAAELVFTADRHARLESYPFDYGAAGWRFLDRFRKIVAVTVHSVEQVPVLGAAFYRALLATDIVHCFHIEPVGWQRFTNLGETIHGIHRDPRTWQQFMHDCHQGGAFVVEDARVVDNAARWSATCGYNIDLLALISHAVDRGDVALTALAYDVVGINPFNPSTLIAWKRTRGSARTGTAAPH
ncbi:MAG TPA: hypothetical protein VMU87_01070 [Stellaceae bacterium]|nr:hypothetical protein [Stellaceae bacterium]